MNVRIARFEATPYCTRATLAVDGVQEAVILELPLKPLVPGGTFAFPAGNYQLVVNRSNRFSLIAGHDVILPLIQDLPGRTTLFHGQPVNGCGLRQHGGNVVNSIPVGQKGGPKPGPYNVNDPNRTDSEGCQLLGSSFGADHRSTVSSRAALAPYLAKLTAAQSRGETIFLTVTNP